ncbi:MAG: ABC transporter permease [Bryobacteraceae bacterium]|nr:ABC transporter permease [Bryobacteraceae bacterium]
MIQDLRYTLRTLARSPLFTLVTILSLALGIGTNTAIFSLFDHVYFRPLPVAAPEQLVLVKDPGPYGNGTAWADDNGHSSFSYPVYRELRDSNQVFSGVAARGNVTLNTGIDDQAAQVFDAEIVSGNYFETLGVRPAAGRLFTANDDLRPGGHPLVVLSHGFWQRQLAGRANVVNSTIRINSFPMTIVGVAAPGFTGTQPGRVAHLFVPMMMKGRATPGDDNLADRTNRWMHIIARLKPGLSMEQATAGLCAALQPSVETTLALQPDLPRDEFQRARTRKAYLVPGAQGRETLRNDSGDALQLMLAMTALVLLVACANVANLLIARGASRAREISIRLSVGATRGALIRQLLVESTVLAMAGGLAGMLVAGWSLASLQSLLPSEARDFVTASLDQRTLLITLGVSLLTGLVFGLLPALQTTRRDVASVMKDHAASTTTQTAGVRFRRLLVAAQFALSLVLLVAGGLLTKGFANLGQQKAGFEVERLVTFNMDATLSGQAPDTVKDTYLRLRERLAAIPGVRDAGVGLLPVLADRGWTGSVSADGCLQGGKDGKINVQFNGIDRGFAPSLGLRVDGRNFAETDSAKASRVVMVNQAFARACYGGERALGRMIRLGRKQTAATIVGLLPDARLNSIRESAKPYVYLPILQAPEMTTASFYLRTAMPEASVIGAAQRVVNQFDANLAVLAPRTLRETINETIIYERLSAVLSLTFALLAVALAAIGLYGVLAFLVTRRTREIGVRLALGAGPREVRWLVMREVLLLAGLGMLTGLPAAWALGRAMRSMLYGLQPSDPVVFVGAAVFLFACAAAAGYWPAHRAARIDPMVALRYD